MAARRPGRARHVGRCLLVSRRSSPTYNETYTAQLKAFPDPLPNNRSANTVALPIMTGGAPTHAMAVEVHLRPLLVEPAASVPVRGRFFPAPQTDAMDLDRRYLGGRESCPLDSPARASQVTR